MAGTQAPSKNELSSRLRLVVARLARQLRQTAQEGRTPSQLSALATIDRLGNAHVGAIAKAEGVATPTLSRLLDALTEQGLITKLVDENDARCTIITLSTKGRELLAQIRSARTAFLAQKIKQLSSSDMKLLEDALPVLESLITNEKES